MAQTSLLLAMTLSLLMVTAALPSKRHHNDIIKENNMISSPRATDVSSVADCPASHYYSAVYMACRPCSHCPANQIIRSPCTARTDTVCGPFYEFDQFHQNTFEVPSVKSSKKEVDTKEHHHHHQNTGHDAKFEESIAGDLTNLGPAGKQWRDLSYALITVLCFIGCLVALIALYVCLVCRRPDSIRYLSGINEPLAQYDEEDSEPRYVDIHATSRRLPAYQHLSTGSDASLFPALTSSECDAKSSNMAATQKSGEDHDYIYINTAAMDCSDV